MTIGKFIYMDEVRAMQNSYHSDIAILLTLPKLVCFTDNCPMMRSTPGYPSLTPRVSGPTPPGLTGLG